MNRWLALAVLAVLEGACAKTAENPIMGNTNWMQACSDRGDCDEGVCACGVCTRGCKEHADCGGFDGATCEQRTSHGGCSVGPSEAVCLVECVADAACGTDRRCDMGSCVGTRGQTNLGKLGLTRDDALVLVPEGYRACAEHADCVVVGAGCDGCCQEEAIAAELESVYDSAFEQVCRDYGLGICNCAAADALPRCVAGACAMVERRMITTCFSPSQNLARALAADALGCPCEEQGARACEAGLTLECVLDGRTGSAAWSVVKGPCVANAGEPTGEPDPFRLTRDDAEVDVPDVYRSCNEHSDCVIKRSGCDSCCQQVAIAAELESRYDDAFAQVCRDYRGSICDCEPADNVPRCTDALCTTVPRESTGDCFSPTQNPERSRDPDAVGCLCSRPGPVVCVGDRQVRCIDTPATQQWAWAVVDEDDCTDPPVGDAGTE